MLPPPVGPLDGHPLTHGESSCMYFVSKSCLWVIERRRDEGQVELEAVSFDRVGREEISDALN